jgi:signal peptidase I
MFFLTPRFIKEAKHYRHAVRRLINYKRDILPPEEITTLETLAQRMDEAIRSRNRQMASQVQTEIEAEVGRIAPPPKNASWRENVEVILVAIVVAAGVRAFFLQPFKIPTGSMQPTLHGVVGRPSDNPPPNIIQRAFDFVWLGRTHFDITATEDDFVRSVNELTYANFFTFTTIAGGKRNYVVFAPADVLARDFGIAPGRKLVKGQPIVRGHVDTGDQLFVDKMSYHFEKPDAGDVFVFKTTGIRRIQRSLPPGIESQHYIKRLVGLPGQTLEIRDGQLLVDGQIPRIPSIERVIAAKDGYRGYTNLGLLDGPEETFQVPPKSFFALGDNSNHSSDSRYWGPVPEQNVTGRGFFVYWPFSKRWGLVR